ncbi:MAG: PTS sugar transporter subunit IIA [Synergistaceae bacterium]|jgi:transcriptional antiterminator/mannitol/fructose-specific phosphotransferase system IIA component (Ntr-type)|nr:PTS sugar transporter subunit IIA [Synergistaceae bacterium]
MYRSQFRVRQVELIKLFLSHNDDWIAGTVISKQLGITERTLRSDIVILNELLPQFRASVISKPGLGYKMIADNYEQVYEQLLLDQENCDGTREDRIRYILLNLLDSETAIDLDDLEEELFVSKTTLEQDLKSIKTMLDNFHPNISLSRRKGKLSLLYDEFSARYLLYRLILSDCRSYKNIIYGNSHFWTHVEYHDVLESVIDIMGNSGLYMSDDSLTKIAVLVCIFKHRTNKGGVITGQGLSCDGTEQELLDLAEKLYNANIKRIVGKCQNEESEIKQLSILLSFINLFQPSSTPSNKINCQPSDQITCIAKELLCKIKEDYRLDLESDEALLTSLIWHINALVNRLRHNVVEKNPINDVMKNEYPFMFELSLYLYDLFQTHLQLNLSEDDLCYVAAYLAAAVERRGFIYKNTKVRIAFVSHLGNSISCMIMAKLQSEYSALADFYGPYPSYQYEKYIGENHDAVLSVTPNFSPKLNIPFFNIIDVFSKSNKHSLNIFIQNIKKKYIKGDLVRPVNFIDKFHQKFFFPNLALHTSEEVITHMCNAMEKEQVIPSEFHNLTLKREQLTPTLMKNYIAIPHPLRPCANTTRIGVATMKKGVPWGDYYAKLVFLLAIKPEEQNFLQDFFEFIVNLMNNKKAVQEVASAKDFNFFIDHVSALLSENTERVRF